MYESHAVAFKQGGLQGTRVMLVEDEQDDRLMLAQFLEKQGCRVYLAENGLDALTKSLVVKPDLVLMDVRMPVLDGVSSCRMMKDDPRLAGIPVIFVSAMGNAEDRVDGLSAGAVDYINKPFNLEELRLRIQVHLGKQGSTAPAPPAIGEQISVNSLDQILFQTARSRLLQHWDQGPDLRLLAESVGTNTRRLNDAFRTCTGKTVFEYLREERMHEAKRLLLNTEMDVQDIAQELGFSTGANFATAFKERFGYSPTQYRLRTPRR